MKIGIPRALLYYYYIPFWKTFFEALEMEVVLSDETNKRIVNKGVKEAVAELCVPIKIYIGHALNLLEKGVDYIFVPRMVSIAKGEYFCPKFMGLPDMMRHGVNGMEEKILSCNIDTDTEEISDVNNYLSLIEPLGLTEEQLKFATKKANEEWKAFRMYEKLGISTEEAIKIVNNKTLSRVRDKGKKSSLKIGLIGYVYNVYDKFVSMDMINKFKELGVDIVTFEMEEEEELDSYLEGMEKKLFWTFSNKLLGAGYKWFSEGDVDGIIQITAFGCGPDSFMSKLFELRSDETQIPFMMIRIDEHTGENHLQTRIEAFVDMLKRKNQAI